MGQGFGLTVLANTFSTGYRLQLKPENICRWARATVMGLKDNGSLVLVKADAGWESELAPWDCHVQNDRDDALDDLVKSDYLHEAG